MHSATPHPKQAWAGNHQAAKITPDAIKVLTSTPSAKEKVDSVVALAAETGGKEMGDENELHEDLSRDDAAVTDDTPATSANQPQHLESCQELSVDCAPPSPRSRTRDKLNIDEPTPASPQLGCTVQMPPPSFKIHFPIQLQESGFGLEFVE
ncbi:hypothetical protein HK102_004646 [Quaeritorhiza haematococci]|nr:hypothetical protein HK102_004646 [Quaeritorhiza haematococci]